MNILVADDHALVRRGLIEFLKGAEASWSFHEAGNLADAEACLRNDAIDLVIMDLNMPGMRGAASLRDLRTVAAATRMIVLTAQDDRATILECLGAGVHGYLPKSGDTTQILEALRIVVAGGVYVPPSLSQIPRDDDAGPAGHSGSHGHGHGYASGQTFGHGHAPVNGPGAAPAAPALPPQEAVRLSGRQQQVLDLLAEGRSTKDIARMLDLGIGTVKVHLAAIYRTLGARNRMEAIVKAGVVSRTH